MFIYNKIKCSIDYGFYGLIPQDKPSGTNSIKYPGKNTKRKWNSLPDTKREIEAICTKYTGKGIPCRIFSGTNATEEIFKGMTYETGTTLHISSHGFCTSSGINRKIFRDRTVPANSIFNTPVDPLHRCGLILANGNYEWVGNRILEGRQDGILTAYELAQLDLGNIGLIVLSSCETGLGDLKDNEVDSDNN